MNTPKGAIMSTIQPGVTGRKPENDDEESDLVWGSKAIGRVINRTPEQVQAMYRAGKLKGAATKIGHRSMVGFKSKLKNLPALKPALAARRPRESEEVA
jgi:hypothetical protein